METTDFISLFDYLGGKPAGPKLGKQVFDYAKASNAKVMNKDIRTPHYSGKVMCYSPSFLHDYFIAKAFWLATQSKLEENRKYFE